MKLGRTTRGHSPSVTLHVRHVRVVGATAGCTAQLAADRTGRTAKAFGNRPDAVLVVAHDHHDSTFLRRQVRINSGQCGTLQERMLHLVLEAAQCFPMV
jgi:hypothetical protein